MTVSARAANGRQASASASARTRGVFMGVPPGVDFGSFCRDSSSPFRTDPIRPWPNWFFARTPMPVPAGRASLPSRPRASSSTGRCSTHRAAGSRATAAPLRAPTGRGCASARAVKGEGKDARLARLRAGRAGPAGRRGGRGGPRLGKALPPYALPHRACTCSAPSFRRRSRAGRWPRTRRGSTSTSRWRSS